MFSTVLHHAFYWDNMKQMRFQCHAVLLLLKRSINDWLKIKGRHQKLEGKGTPTIHTQDNGSLVKGK